MAAHLLVPRVGHPVDPLVGVVHSSSDGKFVARTTVNFVSENNPASSQPMIEMWSADLMELEEDVPRSVDDTVLDLLADALGSF